MVLVLSLISRKQTKCSIIAERSINTVAQVEEKVIITIVFTIDGLILLQHVANLITITELYKLCIMSSPQGN